MKLWDDINGIFQATYSVIRRVSSKY